MSQSGWLKQQKFTVSQFWRPDAQSPGASAVLVPREGCEGKICSGPLFMAGRKPSSVCVSSHGLSPFYKNTSDTRLWAHPTPVFTSATTQFPIRMSFKAVDLQTFRVC